MGSSLSGRRGGKPLVEDCLTLDIAWLMRLGPITGGQTGHGVINWHVDGERFRSAQFRLDLRTHDDAQLKLADGTINQKIALVAVPQHFGGHRWWMRCPLTGKRVRKLHLPLGGERFASREALGLAYRVERLDRFDRPFEKMFRAQRRLGGMQGLGAGLERPKGMWRQTFARHALQFESLDIACADNIAALIGSG